MELLDVFELACRLHTGQVDKAGRPYIEHLTRVFLRVQAAGGDLYQQMAALLHDAIEDRKTSAEQLLCRGVDTSLEGKQTMQANSAFWEVAYAADRRGHHHRCRCCNRVLKDGESALMVRVGWKNTYVIHRECGDTPHGTAAWTWRDAFAHWSAEYQQGKELPMKASNQQQAVA